MAGITANSASVTMIAPDTAFVNANTGYVTTQQVTLSVTPSATTYQWGVSMPAGSSPVRAGLSSTIAASPRFTPDAEGEYVVTCLVDGAVLYVLRMSVAAAIAQSATGGFRMLRHADTTVATPATGDVLYNSTDEGFLAARGSDGVVRVIADRAWVAQAIAVVVLLIPTLTVQGTAAAGDSIIVAATTSDADGHTTTGVDLYDGGTRLGAMTNGGGGAWSFTITNADPHVYALRARRLTAIGYQDSTVHDVDVSSVSELLTPTGDVLVTPSGDTIVNA